MDNKDSALAYNMEHTTNGHHAKHRNQTQDYIPEHPFIRKPLSDESKEVLIAKHFREIMETLGLDLSDKSLKDTPGRVAKMFVREIYSGLNPDNKPKVTLFENSFSYNQMLIEKDITFYSNCEHHFVPIIGRAHVGYISSGKVIGLSKLNRIVQYYAARPQLQERLTMELATELKSVLETDHVAVILYAHHHCVSARGIKDVNSSTITSEYSGKFLRTEFRQEFLQHIK